MKIIYQGYYGAKNSGDDAFVEVAAWGAKKYWNATNHLFFSASLPKIQTQARFLGPYNSYLSFSKAITEVLSSDIFVSAGGSTFHSVLKKVDLRAYAKIKKQIGLKGKTGAIGVSLGPYKNAEAEKSVISYLKTLDFLALRDTYSYELACSYNLPYKPVDSFYLAALLPNIYSASNRPLTDPLFARETPPADQRLIGVSVCNYERYGKGDIANEQKRNDYVLRVLSEIGENKNFRYRFFVFNGNEKSGDGELTTWLIDKLVNAGVSNFEVVPYLEDVELTYFKIQECDLVISTRLHASIFACFAQVPFFLIEYHRKCADFLDDVGQNDKYRLFDAEKNTTDFVHEVNSILIDKNYTAPTNTAYAMEKALLNFTKTNV